MLICGATNSGKTALFYHLVTKEVRTTVSSTEENETSGKAEIKIPGTAIGLTESINKNIAIIDIPGHFHFRTMLNEALENSKAIIVMVDSKEK